MSMAVAPKNILKLLSDLAISADKIYNENSSEFAVPRVSDWMIYIKNKADSIVEKSDNAVEAESVSLMSFLTGAKEKGPRFSKVVTEFKKCHVHRKSKGASVQYATKARQSSIKNNTPLKKLRNSGVKCTNQTFLIDSENEETPKLIIHPPITALGDVGSITGKEETPLPQTSYTPVNGECTTLKMKKKQKKIFKRKSSSELSSGESAKKIRGDMSMLNKTKDEKKLMKANSSLLHNCANVKSSVDSNFSVLKENRIIRSRIETKQEKADENRKNLLAERQKKLLDNQKARQEKLEKTLQQRMKLEKEKLNKLKHGARQINCIKEGTPKVTPKTIAAKRKETRGETCNSEKSENNKEKETSLKKMNNGVKTISSGILKSKTLAKKNHKLETESDMNSTYVHPTITHNHHSTNKKMEPSKEVKIGTKSETVKDASKNYKIVQKTVKPVSEEEKELILNSTNSSTLALKKGPESYDMTPSRSSFVSYDISEIRSDSEDEEQASNSKPIPSWAIGVRLRNSLLQQHHHPIDTDNLFGNYFDPPDLTAIMGISRKNYHKRTSSAVWNSSFR